MARITKINTKIARNVLHSLVAKDEGKYKNTGISKTTFKKEILNRATGSGIQALRGSAKNIDRNILRRSVKDLANYLKENPGKFTVKKGTALKMGARVYEGSKLKEDFDNPEFLKKADRYAVGMQIEENDKKDEKPDEKYELRMDRRNAAMKNLNIRNASLEREKAEKGLTGPQTSLTASKAQEGATSSATSRGPNFRGTIAGASQTAGKDPSQQAPIPGQLNSNQPAKPASPSSAPVHLAGGFGNLGKLTDAQRSGSDKVSMPIPTIGISEDNPQTDEAGQEPGKIVDLASKFITEKGQKTTKTDDQKADEDEDLPNMDDVDKGLPL